jgi:hypothetical protein
MNRKAFTVTKAWGGSDGRYSIYVKSVGSGNIFDVFYTNRINCEVGDTVSIIIDSNDKWKTIINERTGDSATIIGVDRK